MSAEPSDLTREAIHALVDQLDDDSLEAVLLQIENELVAREPLTDQQVTELRRRLALHRLGMGIPHEQVAEGWGLRA